MRPNDENERCYRFELFFSRFPFVELIIMCALFFIAVKFFHTVHGKDVSIADKYLFLSVKQLWLLDWNNQYLLVERVSFCVSKLGKLIVDTVFLVLISTPFTTATSCIGSANLISEWCEMANDTNNEILGKSIRSVLCVLLNGAWWLNLMWKRENLGKGCYLSRFHEQWYEIGVKKRLKQQNESLWSPIRASLARKESLKPNEIIL